MKNIKSSLIAMSIIAVSLCAMPIQGQTYPPEFSPLKTSRPRPPEPQLVPTTKFVTAKNVIPNKYLVVLDDNAVPKASTLDGLRANVSTLANTLVAPLGGKVEFVYEAALRGFSVDLPNEAAAVALSVNPQVRWVEEAAYLYLTGVQNNPSFNLDRIDQMSLPLNNQYVFNATGAGVFVYVIDSGIRASHADFGGRASIYQDYIGNRNEGPCAKTFTNNDCSGHGTAVASVAGGNIYGVAKEVQIRSMKVCYYDPATGGSCLNTAVIAAVNRVTSDHQGTPSSLIVANMSLGGPQSSDPGFTVDMAVNNSINSGVAYAIASGNSGTDTANSYPANVASALTVANSDSNDTRVFDSNYGSLIDVYAPGDGTKGALFTSDTGETTFSGTSAASPHVAGAMALYLQGRTGTTSADCFPISSPVVPPSDGNYGKISTCPDRSNQLIKSNASLSKINNNVSGTPNRLLYTGSLPATTNPVDNQRFFVWQQYGDFLANQPEPDEDGLNFWTGQITNICGTGIDFNANTSCTHTKRIDVSRAFFVAAYPSLFTGDGTALTNNNQFVHTVYQVYLRRSVDDTDGGFQFWLGQLNQYGNPANQAGINFIIDAFSNSSEFRERFGQP